MITLEGLKPLPSARKFLTMLRSIWGRKHGWVLGVCLWGACGFAYRKSKIYVFQWSAWNVQFPAKRPETWYTWHQSKIMIGIVVGKTTAFHFSSKSIHIKFCSRSGFMFNTGLRFWLIVFFVLLGYSIFSGIAGVSKTSALQGTFFVPFGLELHAFLSEIL